MNEAEKKLDWIKAAVARGQTVYVCTYTKKTMLNAKAFASFAKAGAVLLKVKGESLYMARGKAFDCIDGCQLIAN